MRRHQIIRFALFAALLLSFAGRADAATTLNVTTTTDEMAVNANCSLREAIQNSNDGAATYPECGAWGGAPATINIPAGTYTITVCGLIDDLNARGDYDLTTGATITGAGSGATIINGGGCGRVFHLLAAGSYGFSGFTITGGSIEDSGGIRIAAGTVTANDLVINGNSAPMLGGGVYVAAGGSFTGTNVTISSNMSGATGGGVYAAGTVSLTNSTVTGNTAATDGGGMYSVGAITITLDGTTVNNNTATAGNGGGVYSAGTLNIGTSTISGNNAAAALGGGIYNAGATSVTSSIVRANTAATHGGGIYSTGSLTLTNSTIGGAAPADGNTATANNGGGISVLNGALAISGSTIRNNTAGMTGGGVYDMAGVAATITGSTISDNTAAVAAGGVYMENALLTITGSTISGNIANANHGGGVHSLTNLSVSNSAISGNTATTGVGGGIYGRRTVSVSGSTISGNTGAFGGGGIYLSYDGAVATNAAISSSTISGNTAGGQGGGGIFNFSGGAANTSVVTVTGSTISGNSGNVGAGIRNSGAGAAASISTSTISGNTSGAQGGALYNDTATTTLTNSTISGNSSSASDGGGVYTASGSVTFANCTITNNDAATNTDGVYRTGGNLSFTNTIIAGNGTGDDCTGSYAGASNGHNLDSDNTCVLNQVSDLPGSALANLGALASNGGSTQTHALLAGSAAIDAGDNAVCAAAPVNNASQNGIARPSDGDGNGTAICDIGAYEAPDTTPNAFSFTAQTGVALNSVATSNTITVAGINSAANISIAGGTYSKNGGAYTAVVGTVNNGDTVTVQQTSSGSYSTPTTATLTIGGVSGAFNVTTLAAPGTASYTAPSATGTGAITASFTGGGAGCFYTVSQYIPLTGHAASPPAGSAPAGVNFPHGLFDFTTGGCTAGSTITMTITYPQALSAGTQYWKYGPTPGNAAPHWYVLPATIAGNTVTFSITDGGLGDDDLTANGAIVDQGGPGASSAAGIPTLSEWALLLLAGLLGLAGMGAMRRRALL